MTSVVRRMNTNTNAEFPNKTPKLNEKKKRKRDIPEVIFTS